MHRGIDKFTIGLIAAGALAYMSVQPKYELRSQMPAGFTETVPAAQHAAEVRVADAYWSSVVQQVQWSYPYGAKLPDAPPQQFSVAGKGLGPRAESAAVRARYWSKAQTVWYQPSAWDREYAVDFSWLKDPGRRVHQWMYEGTPASE
jgi:hypothetical protein